MSKSNFRREVEHDEVHQIMKRGYPATEVSQRLGVSPQSLYEWKKTFSSASGGQGNDLSEEIRQLKNERSRVTEDRDILKKRSWALVRLGAVETVCATLTAGRELPLS
ncbi:transposase [Agrobacterium cavarae]|uniref:transposase n=1 Tax=Agrobacterium cavarae TaxID=2528239 RepID=UPI00289FF507|nr:transposase [Agrobacterium cavarae]